MVAETVPHSFGRVAGEVRLNDRSRFGLADKPIAVVDEATDIFGRPPGAGSAPEATTHPLLLDTSGIQRAANQHSRVTRRLNRTSISDLQPHNLLATLESLIGGYIVR
jgi:hypothetical protein